MSIIRLPIDTKSLHCNIKNDNKIGHTATVATPLKQGKSYDKELGQIFDIPKYERFHSNVGLLDEITKNARTPIRVLGVFLFDKFAVNGKMIDCDKQFCIYVREEIDPTKAQFGRIKVHYPMSFKFEDDELSIDNRTIINTVSAMLKNYAFLVTAFEYNTVTKILNFRASIVGEPQIPYSKVFVNEKGVGNKFVLSFSDIADHYDTESIALKKHLTTNISPINYLDTMEKNRLKSIALAKEHLKNEGISYIGNMSCDYPYAPYDLEIIQKNITKHILVFFTATAVEYFSMSSKRVRFCNDFSEDTIIFLFTDIVSSPKLHKYTIDEANHFRKDIASIVYTREDC